jgi:two-component system chemotaxis response regulator CheB
MNEYVKQHIEAIVIGASAGGVKALATILKNLPAGFRLPIVVVLHLPEDHESKLAEIFEQHVSMRVQQAEDKQKIQNGTLYFACAGYHLSIERNRHFSLSVEDPVNYARPSIDILMQSAADTYGAALAGILLTGANHDGAEGLAAIKSAGGLTIVQDPEEAEISTMPRAAIRCSKPDLIFPLEKIHALIAKLGNL